jgi:adenosylcobinamide-GDP ribazoletransferase
MYSRIPVPMVEWKEENRRYSLCFFPLIGIFIGGFLVIWYFICGILNVGTLLYSAVSVFIPVLITGGIHVDGFCDVCDAKACCGTKEKMLEVMSDSHTGAFAMIKLSLYFLIQTALFSEIKSMNILFIIALGFIQSRAWSGLAAVTFRSAKNSGALQSFRKPAHKNITVISEIFFILVSSVLMVWSDFICGICAVAGGIIAFCCYRIFSYRKFGGITGDIAGYFLQMCEITIMAVTITADVIRRAL